MQVVDGEEDSDQGQGVHFTVKEVCKIQNLLIEKNS
jgi:hypothetical protein